MFFLNYKPIIDFNYAHIAPAVLCHNIIYICNYPFQMYSQIINYIKQRVEISQAEIEEALRHNEHTKYTKGENILYCTRGKFVR